jgi:hypothetical protein
MLNSYSPCQKEGKEENRKIKVSEDEVEPEPFIRYRCSTMAPIFSFRTSLIVD